MAHGLIRVKLTTSFPSWPVLRQTPGSSGIWGKYQFFVDTEIDRYDFWVFYNAPASVTQGRCDPRSTVFVSAEPPSLRRYPPGFLDQFGTVITCHRHARHRDLRFIQQGLPWHYGAWAQSKDASLLPVTYDQLKTANPRKTKCLSVVSSRMNRTRGHHARLEFARKLKERMGDRLDLYGRGIRGFDDKSEPIAEYRYHVGIENSQFPDYWTEKLADAFLGNAFPFYYGCPNIGDYFPAGSYRLIDIHDLDGAMQIIESTLAAKTFETSQPLLRQARDLVLDKHNLFNLLAEVLDTKTVGGNPERLEIRPREEFEGMTRRLVRKVSGAMPTWLRRRLR